MGKPGYQSQECGGNAGIDTSSPSGKLEMAVTIKYRVFWETQKNYLPRGILLKK